MREIILVALALAIGLMMCFWSIWQIVNYYNTHKSQRHTKRFYFRISWVILLIGLGDFAKALVNLISYF